MLIAAAAATLALAWSSVALAQEGTVSERAQVERTVQLATVTDVAASTLIGAPAAAIQTAPVGPVLTSGLVRYVPSASRSVDAPAVERMQRGPGLGRNVALVIVGVAAMIIGSDVDDTPGTLLVAAGAGMTLYGLYYILK
jgi:hypothetical protein